jgi:hypothetical protein
MFTEHAAVITPGFLTDNPAAAQDVLDTKNQHAPPPPVVVKRCGYGAVSVDVVTCGVLPQRTG